jgi:hypothetical protein
MCRGTRTVVLRWAIAPISLATLAAAVAAAVAELTGRLGAPLAVAVVGLAAAALLLGEVHRRRSARSLGPGSAD